ncbi:malate synthase [Acrasis kona]|uniref:malate synthase n=1 Tax=Acrasis kona TaxID=1008807 RepID=A0AAW2Z472_9EUKA
MDLNILRHQTIKNNNITMTGKDFKLLATDVFKKYFGELQPGYENAIALAVELDAKYQSAYDEIFRQRKALEKRVDSGDLSDLKLKDPTSGWKAKDYPKNYEQYKNTVLEMTGNALNRMGINAYNYISEQNSKMSKATGDNAPKIAWMCCGEDANGAQIESVCENIRHLRDLFTGEAKVQFNGKEYKSTGNQEHLPPTSFRPRGLHCLDSYVLRNNEPIVGSFLDLALWSTFVLPMILNKKTLPLLYIPKMHLTQEAQLWQDALKTIETKTNIPEGTIKIVFLCETYPGLFNVAKNIEAFEGRCIGVNCGRWDYLYSYVQVLANHTHLKVDDKDVNTTLSAKHIVTTNVDLLKKYQIRVAQLCHFYGIQFLGGMNAQLPNNDPDLKKRELENQQILSSTRKNKTDERTFYGASKTWVAHIGLLDVADTLRQVPHNQPIDKQVKDVKVTRQDVFQSPPVQYTIQDFEADVDVVLLYCVQYLLNRNGAIAINNLMEDMATSEISSSLNWFYLKHHLMDNDIKSKGGIEAIIKNVGENTLKKVVSGMKDASRREYARKLFTIVQKCVLELYNDSANRPTLEKLLYALAAKEDNEEAFKALSNSKRFKWSSDVAKLVGRVYAERDGHRSKL